MSEALSWTVVSAVLFGALLHASWNALVKASSDKDLDTALIHLIGSFLALPVVLLIGLPPLASWPYLAASLVIHVGYYFALSGAYRHGDLGLTYPVMRGTAPLLVALSATLFLGEQMSSLAWAGLLGICCGVLALGLSRHALATPKALSFALCNAVIIALYTVVDALGVRASGQPAQYVALLFLLDGWPFALLIWLRRGRAFGDYARQRWPLATLGAAASLASYGIALWAMTQAPMAMVAALRETSVLFAVLFGAWFLKEKFNARRLLGSFTIVGGVMAMRLG